MAHDGDDRRRHEPGHHAGCRRERHARSSGWHGTSLTYRSYIRRISLARLRLLRPPTIEPRPATWHGHQAKSDREGLMMRVTWLCALTIAAAAPTAAQDVVKIGQIEAQTGPNAIYGYMSSQGMPIAVDQINKAGGFKVGDTSYKLELIALDTRGDPKEATIQLKKLL